MNLAGLCSVCGKPARYSCPLCGKLVCETHFENAACANCSGGKKAGVERKFPQAKLKFPIGGKNIKS